MGSIGLVDAYGVLLDLPDDDPAGGQYSFPVLTGIAAADPLSTRAARMKIYQQFIADLDSSGPKLSETLSEVDIANPEDVKALIPEHSSEILVHFGDEDFLDRYQRFQQQLPAWRAQYPNLASVDMRYPNQVVLDMTPGTDASATVHRECQMGSTCHRLLTTVSVPAVTPPPALVADPNSGKKSAATPMAAVSRIAKPTPVATKPVPVAIAKACAPAATKPAAPVAAKPAQVTAKTSAPAAVKTPAAMRHQHRRRSPKPVGSSCGKAASRQDACPGACGSGCREDARTEEGAAANLRQRPVRPGRGPKPAAAAADMRASTHGRSAGQRRDHNVAQHPASGLTRGRLTVPGEESRS